jgi:type III pantothenate kinase
VRIGVVDVGNTRTKRALFDGKRLRPLRGKVEAWIGCRVGKGAVPAGTLLLGRDFPPLVRNGARHPETVGPDRLAQASAAWSRTEKACVVVSMGTAITVDVVNGKGEFVGGLIAPGLRLMARSLHEHTARLPEIEPVRKRTTLGRHTREAIECGISAAAEGLVRRALAEHRGRVFGTGGDAPLFRDLFDELVPDLALEGTAFSWLLSRRF